MRPQRVVTREEEERARRVSPEEGRRLLYTDHRELGARPQPRPAGGRVSCGCAARDAGVCFAALTHKESWLLSERCDCPCHEEGS